jgi:pimeloyl-ACP methyl ester carboxylesterase
MMILAALLLSLTDTPYIAQNVQYYNADSSIHFGATLTIPANKKKSTAVILVSGTGKQDRDGTMGGHKMFFVIADYLSRNGYAVLRVDDRGTGETSGRYEDATTADFAKDVLSGISYLKTRSEVAEIGLVGHSEGGAVAYMAAAESKDVAFMISLAGLATSGLTALKQQNSAIISNAAIPQQSKDRYNAINNILFDTVYAYANAPDLETHIRSAYAAWKVLDDEKMTKELVAETGKGHFFFPLESYIRQATGPWYRYHIRFDPVAYLKQVKVPVLAINGDKDIMVDATENLGNYQRYVKHVTVITAKGLNHLFQHDVKADFAPEVLEEVKEWLTKIAEDRVKQH